MQKLFKLALAASFTVTLGACSTNKPAMVSKVDKREKINRKAFRFNQKLDKNIIKPVATSYQKVTPDIVEIGISNFFANLGDINNAFNNVLQGKIVDAGSDMTRFAFNSTFGLGGILDVASTLQLEKHDEDFGQTLAHWGVKSGSYSVTPFLGASTLRNSTGFWIDIALNPSNYANNSFAYSSVNFINNEASELADNKPDEYTLARDAWIKKRDAQILDEK